MSEISIKTPIVSVQWLQQNLNASNIVLLSTVPFFTNTSAIFLSLFRRNVKIVKNVRMLTDSLIS